MPMKHCYPFLLLIILFTASCDNIQSVSYKQPTKFRKNNFTVRSGTYVIVQPEVPAKLKISTTELLMENLSELLGTCLEKNRIVSAKAIQIDDDKIRNADVESIKFAQPNADYVIHLSSNYKKPVITEFRDSRNVVSPEEHVTGTFTIFDLASNSIIFQQQLIGSTEEKHDPFDEDDDPIYFKATGELLTEKVIKRLTKGVRNNAKNYIPACSN